MNKWSLLLLASVAVFQPIASFTERNLVDGRQQCCDHQPNSLLRDSKLAAYGYRYNKIATEDRRLNDQREIPETRRYEIRSVESALTRETEYPSSRRVVTGRIARFSRLDRKAVGGIDSRDQSSRRISRDRLSRVSIRKDRESQIRTSRDETGRDANERRSRVSMEARREQRHVTTETANIRDRAAREVRNLLQRTRNDVVQDNIQNRRRSREITNMERRSYLTEPESRRQIVNQINKEYRLSLERRVRGVSETRLPLARIRIAEENRRITKSDTIRKIDLNARVSRESFGEDRKVRQTSESRRITDNHRDVLNKRDQTREDFRRDRHLSSPDQRFARHLEREVGMNAEYTERSEGRQTRRVREAVYEVHNNAGDARRSIANNRRNVRTIDRSLTSNNDVERRFVARSMDRRINRALLTENKGTSLSRNEPKNMARNDIRRVQNTRDNLREMREAERHEERLINQKTRGDMRTIPTNNRLFNEIRSSNEDRIMIRRDARASRDVRARNLGHRIENNRHFTSQGLRIDIRSQSRNDERERNVDNRRSSTADRQMERNRREARDGISLIRQARSVENLRTERRDTRFDNRADTRNQRNSNRLDERSSELLVRQSRKQENVESRVRDARINDQRFETVRETRNKEVRISQTADTRDKSETRTRLALDAARYRHDFVSKKATEDSYALNWQYMFYALQGIYLCGVIVKMMNETPDNHKTRSWWGMSTKAIKVD